jgi:hypothetical protein
MVCGELKTVCRKVEMVCRKLKRLRGTEKWCGEAINGAANREMKTAALEWQQFTQLGRQSQNMTVLMALCTELSVLHPKRIRKGQGPAPYQPRARPIFVGQALRLTHRILLAL